MKTRNPIQKHKSHKPVLKSTITTKIFYKPVLKRIIMKKKQQTRMKNKAEIKSQRNAYKNFLIGKNISFDHNFTDHNH